MPERTIIRIIYTPRIHCSFFFSFFHFFFFIKRGIHVVCISWHFFACGNLFTQLHCISFRIFFIFSLLFFFFLLCFSVFSVFFVSLRIGFSFTLFTNCAFREEVHICIFLFYHFWNICIIAFFPRHLSVISFFFSFLPFSS